MNPFQLMRKPKTVDEQEMRALAARADRAALLMRDETLAEAFVEVESVYVGAWRTSAALDIELRERAHMAVMLLGDLKAQLMRFVAEGEAAKREIERQLRRPPAK